MILDSRSKYPSRRTYVLKVRQDAAADAPAGLLENIVTGELRERVLAAFHDSTKRDDPLKRFSEACRRDLASLRTAI